ncbi:hypothetical protein NKR23_g7789 [Pleurostoma richardsiae]|uniref:Uncharacterized protein n=1 Tax=Pleurostoma richardsiae TaxID=41990 RepID=A0AA38R9P5_9PEZI|nr:hypothetical protein NKR23_g7789 [Pleurostoma richardsiae]
MSAHLCKQIAASWREMRQTSPEPHSYHPLPLPSPPTSASHLTSYFHRASSPEKRSMDSDRGESTSSAPSLSRQSSSNGSSSSSSPNWRSGGR